MRIVSVRFDRFKAFSEYSVHLEAINILVGPNNSGKSTVIGAFRALAAALRFARNRAPERIRLGDDVRLGYRLRAATLPISLENVHTDYGEGDATITFTLSNGNRLSLEFPESGDCILVPRVPGSVVTSAARFNSAFKISVSVVPVLGPVEHNEILRERDTVVKGLSTHRASRHFRSYWHYFPDGFDEFAELVRTTWPGMEIQRPELNRMTGELSMFCLEERIARELYWAGFGFQVWCQLLTHLSRARATTVLVVDEPEIYLHPDVQRQLLGTLRELGTDVVVATHSSEIMAEADPTEILLINKRHRSAERLRDVAGVQRAMNAVGSIQNITLTALARNRRVVFVEGDDDFRLLRRFARRLGFSELSAGIGLTALSSGGFGSWERITTLAAGIAETLGTPLLIAAIYDRDYFCQEEVDSVQAALEASLQLAHVHASKEIENYLLVPAALDRAIARAVGDRAARVGGKVHAPPHAAPLLRRITDELRDDVQSQLIARRAAHFRSAGKDLASLTRATMAWFSPRWDDLSLRLSMVPGKAVLHTLRAKLQQEFSISLTDAKIIDAFHRDDIASDLQQLLAALDAFRQVAL